MNNYQSRAAFAIATDREIVAAELPCQVQLQRDYQARELRAENARRIFAATRSN